MLKMRNYLGHSGLHIFDLNDRKNGSVFSSPCLLFYWYFTGKCSKKLYVYTQMLPNNGVQSLVQQVTNGYNSPVKSSERLLLS